MYALIVRSDFLNQIKVAQPAMKGESDFNLSEHGLMRFMTRICVPNDEETKNTLRKEAHQTAYSAHPRKTKMVKDLQQRYWWPSLKNDVIQFVLQCLTCQQVKVEHQRPTKLLKPLETPDLKWDQIAMGFIGYLPSTQKGFNSIWVIVDRFTNSAHFLAVQNTHTLDQYTKVYIRVVVRLHGVLTTIVSDRDP